MPQQVGAFNYVMNFTIAGFDDITDRDWRVVITRPDGTTLERTAADNDVTILDEETLTMGVRIIEGDFDREGAYKLQVWDETDGNMLRSSVLDFLVLNSLEPAA